MAYVCRNLPEIRSLLRDDGGDPSTPLQRLLARARSGDSPAISPLLDAVHSALQQAGDARGIFGNLRGMAGVGLRPIEIVYRCPNALCTGRQDDEVGAETPRCAVTDRELIRDTKR
ncbi:hypothetical protein LTT66_34155 [Nocardia gipuzkoensis]|uniref:hypothetical protein n=1 Tax=Nocardia gipuzkoensis TaxID=2749991 RepID=UPI001E3236B0|nr:hypothetical protein [Nocardia gipuzkoensis]UGT68147.1 hypothetical protein LTT66_34155 [Nocardia gipuzkoensis]